MSRTTSSATLVRLAPRLGALALLSLGLIGCGKVGPLMQPAPLFGERAKAEYYVDRQAQAAAAQQAKASQKDPNGSADKQVESEPSTIMNRPGDDPHYDPDNIPKTTRDVRDPDTLMTTPRNSPVPGAPNSMGPTPDMSPP
jgi:hypothetical protein